VKELSSNRALAAALSVALVFAAVLFAGLARGVPKAYDLPDHLGSTWQVLHSFQHGDFYPRWQPTFNDGFGEATLVFYPPALHMTAAAVAWLFGGDVLVGLYVTLFLFAVLGGVGIFRFVARVFGPTAGAIACLAFALLPYRVFEIYASGLYSAFAAACLTPWALLALARIAERDEKVPAAGLRRVSTWALVFAGIVLTNMPTAVLLGYLVAIWTAVHLLAARRWRSVAEVAGGGLWGCLIATVYLLPAVVGISAIDVPLETAYQSNFLFQATGTWMKPGLKSVFDRMGIFPLLAFVLSLAVFAMVRQWGELHDSRSRVFVRMTATFGLASLFLATPVSLLLWRWLPQLSRVNLPWRLLEPLGLATASGSAAAVALLWRGRGRPLLVRVLALFFLIAVTTVSLFFDTAISDANGHMTAEVCRASIPAFARKQVYFFVKGARRPAEMAGAPPVSCSAPCRVRILEWSGTRREIQVTVARPTRLALRTYFFPGWKAQRLGSRSEPLAAAAEPGTGRIAVEAPAGESRILVRYGTTPARVAGATVSLLAFGAWLLARGVVRRNYISPDIERGSKAS
jgi:hypothetical protein